MCNTNPTVYRPRKATINAITVANTQRSGTKRAAKDTEVDPRKRPKQATLRSSFGQLHPASIDNQHDVVKQDHTIFPFMELPGELRNRIYEMATDYSYRCFPPTCPKPKLPKRARSKTSPSSLDSTFDNPSRQTYNRPIPYLGLTQVCSQIRTEFRPMWLSTHRFPLFALDSYLKAFFPLPKPSTDRKRFDGYSDPKGTLRLTIRPDDLKRTDIFKLLKHKARFPAYNLIIVSNGSPAITAEVLAALSALIENKNPKWQEWVKRNVLSQVRLFSRGFARGGMEVRLVVKEDFAPDWMRMSCSNSWDISDGCAETLGLGLELVEMTGVSFGFGVNYS